MERLFSQLALHCVRRSVITSVNFSLARRLLVTARPPFQSGVDCNVRMGILRSGPPSSSSSDLPKVRGNDVA
jgi:hypothetical protein